MVYSVCLWKNDISDLTLVDLTGNFFVLYTTMKTYICIHGGGADMNIHEGKV